MFQASYFINKNIKIVKPIDRGGFGDIFEVNISGKSKILKVLNLNNFSQSERPKAIALFQREARILSQLKHSGLPKVGSEGYFTWEDNGEIYHGLVLEKIEGENLLEWLKKNRSISYTQAIDWLKQLLEILDEFHQKFIFHRDIKPANIMLRPNGKLVLIDFGTARQITDTYLAKFAEDREITIVTSTEGYTPIEQFQGKSIPQSDFFALGRTIIHLLTGVRPMELENKNDDRLSWRDLVPDIPESFADLIDRMTEILPGDRPQNIREILNILNAIEERLKINKNRDSFISNKIFASFDFLWHKKTIAFLLLIAIAIQSFLFSDAFAVFLNKQGVKLYAKNLFAEARLIFHFAVFIQPDYGKAYYNLGSTYEELKQIKTAIAYYKKAIDYGNVTALNNRGRLLIQNNCKEAKKLFQKAVLPENRKVRYALLTNQARAELCLNNYEKARDYLQAAIEIDDESVEAQCLLTVALQKMGDRSAAIAQISKCPNDPPPNLPELHRWSRQLTHQQLLAD